ncbi:Holliday junction branch migration protein RuvA [Lactococcus termiticola]|uniref:Holliday junction branch migration complex subunit RuvA n=1 Tax=Lactococcus termiticola TaxID=2169526 RepID=A0A2R5HEV2_9LACT|nr:Holliday junction branch migration protein RuvA [Lactococcus termiticola]GBG96594.1 Holliday junction DNA helicase RuvA [Lactococcus termiticola]
MYEYLSGTIVSVTPTYIVLDVAGIGYLLNVANPYSFKLNEGHKIFVHQVIREDAHSLYGFVDAEEKGLFLRLISVTGIGPKSALAIIAASDNAGLVTAIDNNDIKYLTKFPGVGKKTAMQMVLDLAGKLNPTVNASGPANTANAELTEAMEALGALGYKATELKKVEKKLEKEEGLSAEDYIKQALKLMI